MPRHLKGCSTPKRSPSPFMCGRPTDVGLVEGTNRVRESLTMPTSSLPAFSFLSRLRFAVALNFTNFDYISVSLQVRTRNPRNVVRGLDPEHAVHSRQQSRKKVPSRLRRLHCELTQPHRPSSAAPSPDVMYRLTFYPCNWRRRQRQKMDAAARGNGNVGGEKGRRERRRRGARATFLRIPYGVYPSFCIVALLILPLGA